jgi:hypothetical protein
MTEKEDIRKNLEYARGYRDALVDTWEEVLKMATKGYSPQEIQIIAKTKSNDAKRKIELKISELEADLAQDDIIDTDEMQPVTGITEVEPIMEVNMTPRMSYLIKESKPARCYDMIQKELVRNRPALIIARTSPNDIRDRYDIGKTMVIWLTMNEKITDNLPPSALGVAGMAHEISGENDEYIKPADLPKLYSLALNFIDGHSDGVILFEGFEYLVTHNSFQSLMNFFQKLNEYVVQKEFNMVLSLNPSSFDQRQLSLLETEMSSIL